MVKLFILSFLFSFGTPKENQAPQISNVQWKGDQHELRITYDLMDRENDSITVNIMVYGVNNTLWT